MSVPTLFPSRTNSSPRQDLDMFRSLKHKLRRKGSDAKATTPGLKNEDNLHPQSKNTPSTRRPAPTTTTMNDAPPACSAASNAAPATLNATTINAEADDPYAFLSSFDTIFLIDDSGSMAGSRWHETSQALETICPICTSRDTNGIDIFFFNHKDSPFHHNITNTSTVREIFQTVRPSGGTPTGQKLNAILKPYLRNYEANPESTKPINIICITDGEPSDDVEGPLIAAARKLDKLDAPAWQVGVQFLQVGRDAQARKHLQQLDDELAEIAGGDGELRDIVDTVPFKGAEGGQLSGEGILKVVLGAVVNRRLDRKRSKELYR